MPSRHYTYLITDTNPVSTEKYYIGFRSCDCDPEDDKYLGSSTNKDFQAFLRDRPDDFQKVIIEEWPTRQQALDHEIQLIREHNASESELFYNQSTIGAATKSAKTPNDPRPMCPVCNERPCAVNYKKNGATYYRKKCNKCNGKRVKPFVPRWRQKGYKKKMTCDKCGYQARYGSQTVVFHMNGDLNDASLTNLRTVCLNCAVDVAKSDAPWKPGDILKDF